MTDKTYNQIIGSLLLVASGLLVWGLAVVGSTTFTAVVVGFLTLGIWNNYRRAQ